MACDVEDSLRGFSLHANQEQDDVIMMSRESDSWPLITHNAIESPLVPASPKSALHSSLCSHTALSVTLCATPRPDIPMALSSPRQYPAGMFSFYICSSTNIWFSVNPRSRMPCIGSGIYCFPTSSHLRNHPTFSLFLSPLDRTACFLVTICPRGGELLVLLDFSSSSLGVIPQFRGVAAHPLPKPLPTYAPAFHMLPSSGFLLRSHFRPGNIHPFARCLITERELKAAAQLRSRGRTTRPPDRA